MFVLSRKVIPAVILSNVALATLLISFEVHGFVSTPKVTSTVKLSAKSNDNESAVQEFMDFQASQRVLEEKSDTGEVDAMTEKEMKRVSQSTSAPTSLDVAMKRMKTSPRRVFVSVSTASLIALGTNFLGGTSKLLSFFSEEDVQKSGLDLLYPRGDYKRYRGAEYGYSFLLPKEWVADQALLVAKAEARSGVLEYSKAQSRRGSKTLPDAAFGPVGKFDDRGVSQSDENVSVIASPLSSNDFTLRGTLGSPEEAAKTLFRISLAPEGSGRKATLIAACEELRGSATMYQFEYNIDRGINVPALKAISVIAERNQNTLITLTVVAPLEKWSGSADTKYRKMAKSFQLT